MIRHFLDEAEARLQSLRASMTPGQRWTSGLVLGVSLAILVLGAPR